MGRADEILDLAQEMIQTRGFNAFSFQDIAHELGIKKASVQFYFPKKEDLGQKVVQRYCDRFDTFLAELDRENLDLKEALARYLVPFYQVSQGGNLVCLCGVLGGEFVSLPTQVQQEVETFFRKQESWLTQCLAKGAERGEFSPKASPAACAKSFFAALQGALIIARSRHDPDYFHQVAQTLQRIT